MNSRYLSSIFFLDFSNPASRFFKFFRMLLENLICAKDMLQRESNF